MSKTIDRIVSATERAILSRVKSNSLLAEYYNRSSGKKLDWRKQSTMMREQEVKDWKFAIMAATDPYNPRRGALMRFYQSLRLDLHLNSCIDNRILPVQCAPFRLVDSKGDADTEAVKLLERPWYLESVKLVLSNTFEGTKLIEMFDLDEDGELARIREIPQSNFVAQDGIIVYEEFDMEGTSYKEGVYKDYYFQVGEDWNLGMLNTLAMIVLAKKLGLGSWLSYLDKYGVPPIFAITDRYDDKRRDELFEMLENFRSNQFAILQGNEKIEIPNDYNVDAYKSFEALHNMGDALLSKCILGGTGMTDEKSFVGAAKLHETLLKFRNQVDKLTFKFYFNKEIKPRLVKLSSVYAPLDKLYFEYDESETLTLTEILDAIKNLSQYYIFNVAELAKITGLPITDIKDAAGINQPTNNQKKSLMQT